MHGSEKVDRVKIKWPFSGVTNSGTVWTEEGAGKRCSECESSPHSEHRFPTPSSLKEGCRKPVFGVLSPHMTPKHISRE